MDLIVDYFRDVWEVFLDDDDRNLVLGPFVAGNIRRPGRKIQPAHDQVEVQDGILERKQKWLDANDLEVADGIELMMELPQKKVIVSCSGKSEIKMLLDAVGLTEYFDAYFSVDEFLKGKPEPDGFLIGPGLPGHAPGKSHRFRRFAQRDQIRSPGRAVDRLHPGIRSRGLFPGRGFLLRHLPFVSSRVSRPACKGIPGWKYRGAAPILLLRGNLCAGAVTLQTTNT